jgi:quercetin dioxygenase-like cupin family protein
MEIKRAGSQASSKGSRDYFTGTVRVDPLFQAPAPARVSGAAVTFEPGARTAWHTHPLGQTLVVTAGFGRVQRWTGPLRKSGQATSSGSRQAKSTGTGPHRPRP